MTKKEWNQILTGLQGMEQGDTDTVLNYDQTIAFLKAFVEWDEEIKPAKIPE